MSTSWGAPSEFCKGFDPSKVATLYGVCYHIGSAAALLPLPRCRWPSCLHQVAEDHARSAQFVPVVLPEHRRRDVLLVLEQARAGAEGGAAWQRGARLKEQITGCSVARCSAAADAAWLLMPRCLRCHLPPPSDLHLCPAKQVNLGPEGLIPLEVRFVHDPWRAVGA